MSEDEQIARARNTDPSTSHAAAANVTKQNRDRMVSIIWQLVTEFPGLCINEYCEIWARRNDYQYQIWRYNTLSTNFHWAVEYGYIRINGEKIFEPTQQVCQTYVAVDEDAARKIMTMRQYQQALAKHERKMAAQDRRDAKKYGVQEDKVAA